MCPRVCRPRASQRVWGWNMSRLLPEIEMGAVALAVANLDRSLDYYRRTIGLELLERDGGQAVLGVPGRPLLELEGRPGGRRDSRRGRSVPFRPAGAVAHSTRPAAAAFHRHRHEAHRRVRALRERSALPARPGRPRHRGLSRPAARGVVRRRQDSCSARRSWTSRACSRRAARRPAHGAASIPARSWATSISRPPISRSRRASTSTPWGST